MYGRLYESRPVVINSNNKGANVNMIIQKN